VKLAVLAPSLALLAGCATFADTGGGDVSSVFRGQSFAQRACSQCHAVGRSGESPQATAPAFGSIRMRYTGPTLIRELEAIDAVGHYGMPPVATQPGDRRDLAAYIESLS